MNMKALISCGMKEGKGANGDFLYLDYTRYFAANGVTLIPVSNAAEDPESYCDACGARALVLSGGNDIGSFPERDRQEKKLLDIAVKKKLPVLGICRGMQFMNRYFGGGAPLEIKTRVPGAAEHVASEHQLKVVDAGTAELLEKDIIRTNSFHNYGVTDENLSPEFDVLAVCESDGVIEAVRHRNRPVVGVQWHPERKSPDDAVNRALVEAFREGKHYWGAA